MVKSDFLKDIFFGADMLLSILVGLASCAIVSPTDVISGSILKDVYSIAINILAILFSMFFAALTIIVSINDSAFVAFLEEDNLMTNILKYFKFSLTVTFIVLFSTILLYIMTVFKSNNSNWGQYAGQFSLFLWAFSYSIFAILVSAIDAIRLFNARVKFVRYLNEQKNANFRQ